MKKYLPYIAVFLLGVALSDKVRSTVPGGSKIPSL